MLNAPDVDVNGVFFEGGFRVGWKQPSRSKDFLSHFPKGKWRVKFSLRTRFLDPSRSAFQPPEPSPRHLHDTQFKSDTRQK